MKSDEGICVVTNPIGATGNAVRSLLDILSSIEDVSLMTAGIDEDSRIRDQYEVVDIARGGGSGILLRAIFFVVNQFRMCNAVRKRDEQVVWFFGSTAYFLPILFSRSIGRTVVVQPRGDIPLTLEIYWSEKLPSPLARTLANLVRLLERISYRLADGIVTYTPSMADELGLDRYEDKLYPNGARYVDTDTFYPRVPYETRDREVGFLGRIDEEKGIRELAQVARSLSDETKFVFAGDGGLREWLEDELSEEIESGDVELTGWVEHNDVPDVLSRFKILILLSQPTEGLPTVILEAFACGTPVYSTPVSGVPDVVREGETGFLIGEDVTPAELAADIDTVLDEEDLEGMSDECLSLIEESYTFDAAVERYTGIIDELDREQ